jgi:hypothetical protein
MKKNSIFSLFFLFAAMPVLGDVSCFCGSLQGGIYNYTVTNDCCEDDPSTNGTYSTYAPAGGGGTAYVLVSTQVISGITAQCIVVH